VRLTALPYSLDLALLASSLLPAEFFCGNARFVARDELNCNPNPVG
jgi:hypothetical protein